MGGTRAYRLFFLLLTMILLLPVASTADMGMIQASEARVTEDAQKAIILHNGEEQVLILGTVLKADRNTPIIRFIPFPSEPQVSLAEGDPFLAVSELLQKHKLVFLQYTKSGSPTASPVEISFNAKIGAHDVTIIKINEIIQFRDWVNEFFKKRGLPAKEEYPEVESIAADYVSRGIRYFVFDFVELTTETQSVEPLIYRFDSKDIYYPLKTSNSFGGEGGIDLIFIGPGTLCPTPPAPYDSCFHLFGESKFFNVSTSAEIQQMEARKIYPAAEEFFGADNAIFMQLLSYYGRYEFEDDVFFDPSKLLPYAFKHVEKQDPPWRLFAAELLKEIRGKCDLKPEPGPCKAFFEKYYFDPESRTCRKFIWGGCDGLVPFETMEECAAACTEK